MLRIMLMCYIPLLNIDMLEHAYLFKLQEQQNKYINNFYEIIDFTYANNLYDNINKRI